MTHLFVNFTSRIFAPFSVVLVGRSVPPLWTRSASRQKNQLKRYTTRSNNDSKYACIKPFDFTTIVIIIYGGNSIIVVVDRLLVVKWQPSNC